MLNCMVSKEFKVSNERVSMLGFIQADVTKESFSVWISMGNYNDRPKKRLGEVLPKNTRAPLTLWRRGRRNTTLAIILIHTVINIRRIAVVQTT